MAIINRGIFQLTDTVFERSVGNDWPTAQVLTTFEIAEGSNLYYTNARVLSYVNSLNLGSNLDAKTTDDLREGTNLYYTNTRVLAHLAESDVNIYNLSVTGNLIIEGNTITLNTETVNIEDKNILLANGAINAAAADGAGITVDGADASLVYVSASDKWQFNKPLLVNNFNVLTTANTTTDLSEGNNLYYTNARVYANIQATSVNVHSDISFDPATLQQDDILIWNGTKFVAQQVNAAVAANVSEYVLSLSLNDTDDLQEGNVNLYFTDQRAIDALTPGRGISISQTGIISSQDDSADFNLLLDGGVGTLVPGTSSNVLIFPSPVSTSDRFILRTIQVTNITDYDISVTGNMILSGNTVTFSNKIPIPVGGSIEFLKRAQAFNRNDSINMVGYTANGTPLANLASVNFAYETVPTTAGLFSTGINVNTGNVNHVLYDFSSTYGVVESIKLINTDDSNITKAKVIWADANNNPLSYFAYNLELPRNSSVEVLSATKRINSGNKLLVNINSNTRISAIVSGRLGDITQILSFPTNITSGQSASVYWETDLADGTTVYYSIE